MRGKPAHAGIRHTGEDLMLAKLRHEDLSGRPNMVVGRKDRRGRADQIHQPGREIDWRCDPVRQVHAVEVAQGAKDPGRVRTAMRAKAYPGEDPATLPDPESLTDVFLALCSPSCNRHGEIIAG